MDDGYEVNGSRRVTVSTPAQWEPENLVNNLLKT